MSEAYVIEAGDSFRSPLTQKIEAGLVLRERGGFRFFAAHSVFAAIENKLFRRPAEAERAAAELLARAREESGYEKAREQSIRRWRGEDEGSDAVSYVDPLALPPEWNASPTVLGLSFLPFDR